MFSDKVSISFQSGVLGLSLALSVGLNIFQTKALVDMRRTTADLRSAADIIKARTCEVQTYASAVEFLNRENRRLFESNRPSPAESL